VPIVLKGEPRGVKQQGGVLDFVHREIEVECLPARSRSIEVDVSELAARPAVRVRDLVRTRSGRRQRPDTMLVHVVRRARRGGRRPRPPWRRRRRPAEPEVIKKGKTDKEDEKAEKKK
jgi:large subunit ribosomal protein L25